MIGRYSLQTSSPFEIQSGNASARGNGKASFNAAPLKCLPIVHWVSGSLRVSHLFWGRRGPKSIPVAHDLEGIIAQQVSIDQLPVGRHSGFRCVVPADGFYIFEKMITNWDRWYFSRSEGSHFLFLGIWIASRGDEPSYFTLIHNDISGSNDALPGDWPVLLPTNEAQRWLDPALDEDGIVDLLLEPPDFRFRRWRVNRYVDSRSHDNEWCRHPASPPMDFSIFRPRAPVRRLGTIRVGAPRIALPSWTRIQRSASESSMPLEGGRADGNGPR